MVFRITLNGRPKEAAAPVRPCGRKTLLGVTKSSAVKKYLTCSMWRIKGSRCNYRSKITHTFMKTAARCFIKTQADVDSCCSLGQHARTRIRRPTASFCDNLTLVDPHGKRVQLFKSHQSFRVSREEEKRQNYWRASKPYPRSLWESRQSTCGVSHSRCP